MKKRIFLAVGVLSFALVCSGCGEKNKPTSSLTSEPISSTISAEKQTSAADAKTGSSSKSVTVTDGDTLVSVGEDGVNVNGGGASVETGEDGVNITGDGVSIATDENGVTIDVGGIKIEAGGDGKVD